MQEPTVEKLIAGTVLGVALLAAGVATFGGSGPRESGPTSVAPTTPSSSPGRTVLVSSDRMPRPSPAGTRLHSLMVSGSMPSRTSTATVLTDEDCAPDARGVSRCLNRLRLASGRTLDVRHPHRMVDVPCLSPGERVRVRPA